MNDLISRAAAIDAVINDERIERNYGDVSPEGVIKVIESLPAVDAIPIDYLMLYAQLPTEFAIAAWQKPKKEAALKQAQKNDKPMSFVDALKLVDRPQWISVKDKKPTTNGKYVVTGEGKVWICEWLDLFGFAAGFVNDISKPTIEAWMPLEH